MSVIKGTANISSTGTRNVTTTIIGDKVALDVVQLNLSNFTISGAVDTFADLPDASINSDLIYQVTTSTGIYLINRIKAGLYKSDGTNWNKL